MVLVDTSIWVDHFRHKVTLLEDLLISGEAAIHQFIIGELACGNIRNRKEILALLCALPTLKTASHAEALHLVEARGLHGKGIGWVEINLNIKSDAGKEMEADQINVQTTVSSRDYGWEETP